MPVATRAGALNQAIGEVHGGLLRLSLFIGYFLSMTGIVMVGRRLTCIRVTL
jgi:hypothetical protein